jgi:peptidoglycan/LPS O-acetylase OafA/YrhL
MGFLKKHLMNWGLFGDLSLAYSPSKVYEAIPLDEHEGSPTWRTRASSTGPGDAQTHGSSPDGTPIINLSLPTDRFSIQGSPESHSRPSMYTAGILTTTMLMNALRFLRPSFLYSSHGGGNKPYKIQPTTYLNGVRGFAALCVCFQHYLVKYNKFLDNGYLSGPDETRILQLPFIRLIFTGRFMVANFFILSGFVLSCKPLRLVRKRDPALLECLASSVFRRVPRLFLPLVATMVVTAFCTYAHWYNDEPEYRPLDPNREYPDLLGRLSEEFGNFEQLVNPFSWGNTHPRHTPHMWTLPMEFRGSMIVFLSILCLSKAKVAMRVLLLAGFACYCLQTTHWDTFLFVSGTLLAEFHLIQKDTGYSLADFLQLVNIHNKEATRFVTIMSPIFWSLVFLFGLYLGSWPCNNAAATPGLVTLDLLTPQHYNGEELHGYFWYSIAAVMIMMAFENFPALQRPFTTPLARYLGDISFSFYIIHWTFLWTVGRVITNETIALFGKYWGFAFGAIIVIPMAICIADVYWRMFDVGSVTFAKWFWTKCSISEPHVTTSRTLDMQTNTTSTIIAHP